MTGKKATGTGTPAPRLGVPLLAEQMAKRARDAGQTSAPVPVAGPPGATGVAMNDVSRIDTTHVRHEATPWLPFTPVSDELFVKYLRIEPTRGELTMLMRSTGKRGAHIHRHTGMVMVYTLEGAWKLDQHDWIAAAGDLVFEPAESVHSFTPQIEGDIVTFIFLQGEIQFLDGAGQVIHTESWRTSLERYRSYCAAHGIAEIPLSR